MKEKELREKVENILKLDFNDDDQTESILSLINKEVLKARIDELGELKDVTFWESCDHVREEHNEKIDKRIEQLQSKLNEVENERGE